MGWIAALISTSVLVILWFWEVRRRLREQHSMVESARSQMDSCRRRAAGSSGDADAAQVLRRCEDIYRQAAALQQHTAQTADPRPRLSYGLPPGAGHAGMRLRYKSENSIA